MNNTKEWPSIQKEWSLLDIISASKLSLLSIGLENGHREGSTFGEEVWEQLLHFYTSLSMEGLMDSS
jgi:hypothetical protein